MGFYWLILIVVGVPALLFWLLLSGFVATGLFVRARTADAGSKKAATVVVLIAGVFAALLLLRPEIEDVRRAHRMRAIAAQPRISAPDVLPGIIHLRGFYTKDALRVAQLFDRKVIQQFADKAQIVTGETAVECPGLVEHRSDREYRVPCPDFGPLSLPQRYLSLRTETSPDDKDIGILRVVRLLLVDGDNEQLIEAAAVEIPRVHGFGRIADIVITPRKEARICLGGERRDGPVDPVWFLAKVLIGHAHADGSLCRIDRPRR